MFLTVGILVLVLAPLFYVLLNSVVPWALGVQDLKKKYCASWALVTGGSSGIGKELSRKLLSQGLDVIIVALDEPIFNETVAEFKKLFPDRVVRQVKADLTDASGAWMEDVKKATSDISVQILFCNAGYMVTGFFETNPVEAHLANFNCNLTANVRLIHHFYSEMISKELRGCVVVTSSSAGFIPTPFAAMYGCTKAGISNLASSLAVEGKARGVDVHAVHPSPVHSRFKEGGGNKVKVNEIECMDSFYKLATGPEVLPDQIFSAVGRSPVMIDLGSASIGLRMVVHFLGYNTLNYGFAVFAPLMPDFKNNLAKKKA